MRGKLPAFALSLAVLTGWGCGSKKIVKDKGDDEDKPVNTRVLVEDQETAPAGEAGANEKGPEPPAETPSVAAEPPPIQVRPDPATTAAKPTTDHRFTAIEDITDDKHLLSLVFELKQSGKSKTLRKQFEALQSKGSVGVLLKALNAQPPNIRSQAALILNRMDVKSKAFSDELDRMVLSDPDEDVRGVAGRVLVWFQRHKKRWNTDALMLALELDKTEAVRMHAAWALGASHDKKGVPALIGALEDESTDVRLRAVGALKRIKSKRALPHLVKRLKDSNTLVKQRAREALAKIRGKDLTDDAAWEKAYPEK